MIFKKKYDYIIPIGSNCRVAIALRECSLRKYSMPFDWMLSTMKSVNGLFENDFKNFLNYEDCEEKKFKFVSKRTHSYVLNKKFNLNITHEPKINNEVINKYNRRIKRMYDILENNKNKILFIRNSLDGVIFDELHRHYLTTEKNYIDFEKIHIQKFNSIINEKFNVEYDILVINHAEKIEFDEKNIFNITSTVKQDCDLWDHEACKIIIKNLKTN